MSAFMSALGGAEKAAGSNLANLGGGIGGNIASAVQARKQRDFVKWQMGNRYQMQVRDMQAAGLNPALSYSNAAPGPVAGGMASIANPAQGTAAARLANAQARKAGAEATITEAGVPGAVLKEKVLRDFWQMMEGIYNSAKDALDPEDALKEFMHDPNSAKNGVDFNRRPSILNGNGEPKSQRLTPAQEKAILRRHGRKPNSTKEFRRKHPQYRKDNR